MIICTIVPLCVAVVSSLLPCVLTANTEAWRTRAVYQILTDRFSQAGSNPPEQCGDLRGWCGGTFRGIIDQLDYIQQLGADAIWFSPIVLNTVGGYHGYWAKDIYEIDPHYGTRQDLLDLVQACKARDIFLMLDVVPNHMGYPPGCSWYDSPACTDDTLRNVSGLVPFNEEEHYHTLCPIDDYDDQQQVEECRLAKLPDLNQTVPYVRSTLLNWINATTMEYDFDGYRIDTTRHIAMDFWPEYQSAARVFTVGEVSGDNVSYVAQYQGPLTSVFNFPLYWTLRRVFNEGILNFNDLRDNVFLQRQHFENTLVLGTFIDNHDVHRFLNLTADTVLFRNALAYLIFADGIPFIYYGSEQSFSGGGDPNNRESLWPHFDIQSEMFVFIQSLLSFRRDHVINITSHTQVFIHVDADSLAFAKSEMLVFVSRFGAGSDVTSVVSVPWSDGTLFTNVLDPSDVIEVQNGELTLEVVNGEPLIYHRFSDVGHTVASG